MRKKAHPKLKRVLFIFEVGDERVFQITFRPYRNTWTLYSDNDYLDGGKRDSLEPMTHDDALAYLVQHV